MLTDAASKNRHPLPEHLSLRSERSRLFMKHNHQTDREQVHPAWEANDATAD